MALGGDHADDGAGSVFGAEVRARGPQRRGGCLGYVIALCVPLIGLGMVVALALPQIAAVREGLTAIEAPGSGRFEARTAGGHGIFVERDSSAAGPLPVLEFVVRDPDGAELPVSRPSASLNYNFGGRQGDLVAEFLVVRPGPHEVSARFPDGASARPVSLRVGRNFVGGLLVAIFSSCGILIGSVVLAFVIALITFIRNRTA